MSIPTVVAIGLGLLVILYVVRRIRFYRRQLSEASFRAFHDGLSRALQAAKVKAEGPPSVEDGSAFVTEAGIAGAVTLSTDEQGCHLLHISLSQPGGIITRAVACHVGFLVVATLEGNTCELSPYFTGSGVHHLVFRLPSRDVIARPFAESYSAYLSGYRPVPYVYEPLVGSGR
jgi:hypothetical protein